MSDKSFAKIVTHNGSFHADDVFAVATLKILLGQNTEIEVIRSREKDVWESADYVVDVGGVYDESRNRFDHHQPEGAGARENGISYSSLGLVWKSYGEILCGDKKVSDLVDRYFVQPIDAVDCGIDLADSKFPGIRAYSMSDFVSVLRPSFQETPQDFNKAFDSALSLAMYILERVITHARGVIYAEKEIESEILNSPSKSLIEINHTYPWQEVINKHPEVLFVYYQYDENQWRLRSPNKSFGTFEVRKQLPKEWAGLNGDDLAKVSGVADATFCHRARFTCGAKTKEGVLKMAQIALSKE